MCIGTTRRSSIICYRRCQGRPLRAKRPASLAPSEVSTCRRYPRHAGAALLLTRSSGASGMASSSCATSAAAAAICSATLAGSVLQVLLHADSALSNADIAARLGQELLSQPPTLTGAPPSMRSYPSSAGSAWRRQTAMIVGDLPPVELARRLADAGLRLRTGPVVSSIQSPLARVAQGVAQHYADYPIEEPDGFADFHVRVAPPRSAAAMAEATGRVPVRCGATLPAASGRSGVRDAGVGTQLVCQQPLPPIPARARGNGGKIRLRARAAGAARIREEHLVRRTDQPRLAAACPTNSRCSTPSTGNVVPLPRPVSLKNASIAAIRQFSHRGRALVRRCTTPPKVRSRT